MRWIIGILSLEWFNGEKAKRNWAIVLGILLYSMFSIWLAHLGEQKARELTRLKKENRRLHAEYVETKKALMHDQLRSRVYEKLKDRSFVIPKRPPHLIEIREE